MQDYDSSNSIAFDTTTRGITESINEQNYYNLDSFTSNISFSNSKENENNEGEEILNEVVNNLPNNSLTIWESQYTYLTELCNLLSLQQINYGVIYLFDYDNNNINDALVCELSAEGLIYYLINNISCPQIVLEFGNSNEVFFLCDSQKNIVIKYTSNFGHTSNSTASVNYIFFNIDGDINEIKHVHYMGTAKPEEFYIELQGEKKICTEEELYNSISEIEQNLDSFSDFETFEMTIADDEITIIGLD